MLKKIEELAQASGQEFSAAAIELLSEALKMRRCPGIGFADSTTGRHARLLGTGIDVCDEIIATYQGLGRDPARPREAYHCLSKA